MYGVVGWGIVGLGGGRGRGKSEENYTQNSAKEWWDEGPGHCGV